MVTSVKVFPVLYDYVNPYRVPVYAPGFGPGDPVQVSMTRQEFAEEADINSIMARYDKVGVWPLPPNDAVPQYLDVTNVPDLMTAMQVMEDAQRAFMTLPATVRREFDNDPVQFVAFAEDPDNLAQMREWKLAPPAPPPDPTAGLVDGMPSSPGGVSPPPGAERPPGK